MACSTRAIRAVIFDMDDTLLDWSQQEDWLKTFKDPHLTNVYTYLSAAHTLPDQETFCQNYQSAVVEAWQEAKKTWAGVNFADVLAQCFVASNLDPNEIDMAEVLRVFDWQPVPGVTLYEDTIPILTHLREQGYKIGLITNSMMPMWMRDVELSEYGILDYFEARVTSGDVGYMKPHPAIYEQVLQLLNVTAETAVFVGDRPENDIAGANAAGLISIWMNPPHLNYELGDVIPDYEISTLQELPATLAAIEKS